MTEKKIVTHMGFKCIGPTITHEKIISLRQEVFENSQLQELREILHAISGKMRSRILYLLHLETELCVCDLSDILDESLSAVSHQLKILRKHDLVQTRRDSKTIFYSLNEPVVQQYLNLEHIENPMRLAA